MSKVLLHVWQTVLIPIRGYILRHLIWVYTVCKGLYVPILRLLWYSNTYLLNCVCCDQMSVIVHNHQRQILSRCKMFHAERGICKEWKPRSVCGSVEIFGLTKSSGNYIYNISKIRQSQLYHEVNSKKIWDLTQTVTAWMNLSITCPSAIWSGTPLFTNQYTGTSRLCK